MWLPGVRNIHLATETWQIEASVDVSAHNHLLSHIIVTCFTVCWYSHLGRPRCCGSGSGKRGGEGEHGGAQD